MPPAFPSTIAGKIEYATNLKNEGNTAFKEGDLRKARNFYTKVFAFTRGLPGSTFDTKSGESFDTSVYLKPDEEKITPDQEKACVALELSVRLNLATIYIKENKAVKAIEQAEYALERDNENYKANLRHGQGKAMIKEWESARFSLLRAKQFAPEEHKASIITELARVIAKQKEAEAAEKDIQRQRMKNAFGGDDLDD